jgi:hypothetical protein
MPVLAGALLHHDIISVKIIAEQEGMIFYHTNEKTSSGNRAFSIHSLATLFARGKSSAGSFEIRKKDASA